MAGTTMTQALYEVSAAYQTIGLVRGRNQCGDLGGKENTPSIHGPIHGKGPIASRPRHSVINGRYPMHKIGIKGLYIITRYHRRCWVRNGWVHTIAGVAQ